MTVQYKTLNLFMSKFWKMKFTNCLSICYISCHAMNLVSVLLINNNKSFWVKLLMLRVYCFHICGLCCFIPPPFAYVATFHILLLILLLIRYALPFFLYLFFTYLNVIHSIWNVPKYILIKAIITWVRQTASICKKNKTKPRIKFNDLCF